MPYDLAALATKSRDFRTITPNATDTGTLLRLYTPILQTWRNSAARSMNAYVLALQTGAMAGLDDEDSQTAAEVAALLALIQFGGFFGKVETWHRGKWLANVQAATGVDAKWMTEPPLGANRAVRRAVASQTGGVMAAARNAPVVGALGENITSAVNGAVASSLASARSLSDEARNRIRQAVLGGIRRGAAPTEVARDINTGLGLGRKRAGRIAENEMDNAVKAMTRARMVEAGMTLAEWLHYTPLERARPTHLARNHRVFDLDDPVWSEQYLPFCRCAARPRLVGLV